MERDRAGHDEIRSSAACDGHPTSFSRGFDEGRRQGEADVLLGDGHLLDLVHTGTREERHHPLHEYLHDDFTIRTENTHEDETKNAHSHLRQVIAGRMPEYVAVGDGSLLLGVWQRVMLVELDRARERELLIQVCGI